MNDEAIDTERMRAIERATDRLNRAARYRSAIAECNRFLDVGGIIPGEVSLHLNLFGADVEFKGALCRRIIAEVIRECEPKATDYEPARLALLDAAGEPINGNGDL